MKNESPPPAPPRGRETIRMVFSSPRGGREGAFFIYETNFNITDFCLDECRGYGAINRKGK